MRGPDSSGLGGGHSPAQQQVQHMPRGSESSVCVQEESAKEGVSSLQGWYQLGHQPFHRVCSEAGLYTGLLHVLWSTLMHTLRRHQGGWFKQT